jgi:hypothetical protein
MSNNYSDITTGSIPKSASSFGIAVFVGIICLAVGALAAYFLLPTAPTSIPQVIVPENSTVTLTSQVTGTTMQLSNATYVSPYCPTTPYDCTAAIGMLVDGQTTATIVVSDSTIGFVTDPCSGYQKVLELTFSEGFAAQVVQSPLNSIL